MSLLAAGDPMVRDRPMRPISRFKVGGRHPHGGRARSMSAAMWENVAYPEGTCAEAGAIAAMVAGGETAIAEVCVIADSPEPVPPCGGCRQKIAEFAAQDVRVTLLHHRWQGAGDDGGRSSAWGVHRRAYGPGLMDARAIIAKLRDGDKPGAEELRWFRRGLASGTVTDAQAGAFAMAVLLNGVGRGGARRPDARHARQWQGAGLGSEWPGGGQAFHRGASGIACRCCWPRRWRPAGPLCQ